MAAKTNALKEKADQIFSKRYILKSKYDKLSLPKASIMFSTPTFTIDPLLEIKTRLNDAKTLLNSKDIETWRSHTSKTNPCGLVVRHLRKIIKPELCTQAWAKFYEIVSSCSLIPTNCIESKKLTTLHLCEAPGAFIASLNHFLKTNFPNVQWEWLASTLNPFYEGNNTKEMISSERFILETLEHWEFGKTYDGDLMQWSTIESLLNAARGSGKVDIVTADGSISCADEPEKQELAISQLLYCEVVAALVNLACGGSLLVKMFTMFEGHTIGILLLLSCLFEEIEIIKPGTSKPGNSEVYCVCTSFAGPECLTIDFLQTLKTHYTNHMCDNAIFPQQSIPHSFIVSVVRCASFFANHQIYAIEKNIELFESFSKGKFKFLRKLRSFLAEEFVDRFNVQLLRQESFVVSHVHLDGSQLSYWPESAKETYCNSGMHHTGSYEDRLAISKLGWHERTVLSLHDESPLISEDDIIQKILHSDISLKWLETAPYAAESDVHNWSIDLGKPIKKVQSSRFCPATSIHQLNEARVYAKVLNNLEGRQLIQHLECIVDKKSSETNRISSDMVCALQKCGLLTSGTKFIDISGNGRFACEILKSKACSKKQCIALFCQECNKGQNEKMLLEFEGIAVLTCSCCETKEMANLKTICERALSEGGHPSTGMNEKDEGACNGEFSSNSNATVHDILKKSDPTKKNQNCENVPNFAVNSSEMVAENSGTFVARNENGETSDSAQSGGLCSWTEPVGKNIACKNSARNRQLSDDRCTFATLNSDPFGASDENRNDGNSDNIQSLGLSRMTKRVRREVECKNTANKQNSTDDNCKTITANTRRTILGSIFTQCENKSTQELSNRATFLKQCSTALNLLQTGDSFICELSDTLTQFTVGIIYILHQLFNKIALVSREFCPTSKQFLVCHSFTDSNDYPALLAHLEKILDILASKPATVDIISVVPIKKLFSEKFYQYIRTQATRHVVAQFDCIVKCERLLLSKSAR